MSIALDQAINYRSKYAMTVESKTLAPKKNTGYSRSRSMFRKAVNVLLVFSIMAMTFFGMAGGTQKAEANPIGDMVAGSFDLCKMMDAHGVWFNGPTSPYMGPVGTLPEGKNITAYEKYGMAGTVWTVWRGPTKPDSLDDGDPYKKPYEEGNAYYANGVCIPSAEILSAGAANALFTVSKVTVFVSGLVYQTAYEGKDNVIDPMQKQIAIIINPEGGGGLKDALYLEFLVPVVMLSALYLAHRGLIQRKSSEALSAGMWMLGSAVTGLFLLNNPMVIPYFANTAVNSVTEGIMTGTTSASSDGLQTVGTVEGGPSALCAITDETEPQRKISRTVQCSLWYSFIYVPWATGQYGVSPTSPKDADKALLRQYADRIKGEISLHESGSGNGINNVNWPLYQLDNQVNNGSGNKDDKWVVIPEAMLGLPDNDEGKEGAGVINTSWKGDAAGGLISKAFFSLIASIGAGIMIVSIGMSMIVFEIGLVILMLLAPLFLLIGVHPGFGRRIALKWIETIINLTLKRIVLSILLGVMITFYSIAIAIPEATMPWYGTLVLIVAISMAGMKYKDSLTDMFSNVDLGGGGGMKEPKSSISPIVAGAAAGVAGAVITGAVANRASSAAVIRGSNSKAAGVDGKSVSPATARSKRGEEIASTASEGFGDLGGAGGAIPAEASSSLPNPRSGPKVSSVLGESVSAGSAKEAVNEVGEGLAGAGASAAGPTSRKEALAEEQKQSALAAAATRRQELESRLNEKMAKTSKRAKAGTLLKSAAVGAVKGATGASPSEIISSHQRNSRDMRLEQRRKLNDKVGSASNRQAEYASAWNEYHSASSDEEKAAANKKIENVYSQMTRTEKSYLKGVGKVNENVNHAMGLPRKPQAPQGQADRKAVAPERKFVNPNVSGGLPRRPQP